MAKTITRTLRSYGNIHYKNAIEEKNAILKANFPDFVEIPFGCSDFRDCKESQGRDKLVIYAYYWRGEWSSPTKEVYARLYDPKS